MRMSLKNICLAASAALTLAAGSANAQVVISQVYGGGGNSGALYTNDFIELFNRGATAVDISGWSVQYGSVAGTTWTGITLIPGTLGSGTVTLLPGQYYLIQEAAGTNTTLPALPTPDLIGTIAMAGGGARVALVNNAVTLTGACPGSLIDEIGWGPTASCSEGGAPAGATANSTAAIRGDSGCMDTGNNAADFAILAPTPRNTASPTHACGGSTPPSGIGASTPASVCNNTGSVVMTVTVTPGTLPTSTGISVFGDTTSIGGFFGASFLDDGVAPDAVAGDNIFTASQATVTAAFLGNQSVPITINDAQARVGNASVVVNVINCNPTVTFTGSSAACESYPQLFVAAVTPGQSPASTGLTVTVDMSTVGINALALNDSGLNGDPVAGDGFYGAMYTLPSGSPAVVPFTINLSDAQSRTATNSGNISSHTGCTDATSSVVISQLYGGGGNSGATLTNDFVELFNRGSTPVNIAGWSLQRLSANGTALDFPLPTVVANYHAIASGVIQPGQYFLIQEAAGTGGTTALPTPDATGAMTMSASDGMMFLSNSSATLTSFTDPAIMDRLGYGSNGATPLASFEGIGAANSLGNTVASFRLNGGCQDTDNNSIDFYRATPAPRNSASPTNSCNPGCPADLDNGTGTGVRDGGVDINDLLFFLAKFELGDVAADLDNGSGLGIHDGGVDINDLLYFLLHFEAGC